MDPVHHGMGPQPSDPRTQATDLGAQATDPGAQATNPGAQATNPGAQATDPEVQATDLGAQAMDTRAVNRWPEMEGPAAGGEALRIFNSVAAGDHPLTHACES